MTKNVFDRKSVALSIMFAIAGVSQSANACCVTLCPQCSESSGESSAYKSSLNSLKAKTKSDLLQFKINTLKGLALQGQSVSAANDGMVQVVVKTLTESDKALLSGINKIKNRLAKSKALADGSVRNAPPNNIDMSNEYLACAYKQYPEKVWKKQIEAGQKFKEEWDAKYISKRIKDLASDEPGTAGGIVNAYIEGDPSKLTMGDAIVLSEMAVSGYDKVGKEPEVDEVINGPTKGQKTVYESTRKLVKLKTEVAKKGVKEAIEIKNAYAPIHEAVFQQSLSNEVYLKDLNTLMVGKDNHIQTKLRMIEQLSMRNSLALEELQRLVSALSYRSVYYADGLSDKERKRVQNIKYRMMGEIGVK